jgi:hypothetical protein
MNPRIWLAAAMTDIAHEFADSDAAGLESDAGVK